MNSLNDIWQEIIRILSSQLTPTAITTWFSDCEPVEIDDCRLVLHTTTDFKRSIINSRFGDTIKAALSDLFSCDFDLLILAGDEINDYVNKKKDDNSLPEMAGYTFDRFIVGNSNKFAHAAAIAVAENPGKAYNPLFIYGNSGLGKTHLLLMDDIQFIAGKQQTQEEFFHTFNTLYEAGKQIVVTSDRPPMEMNKLEDRIRTRLEWGLMADVQPPDLETRMAITRNKAAQFGVVLPDEVVTFIGETVTSNIRQLEGVVKKLTAYRDLLEDDITVSSVRRAIKDVIRVGTYVPTPNVIIAETARYFSVSEEALRGQSRQKNTATARQVAMYLCRNLTNMALTDIGAQFEGRNHATVLASIRKIEDMMQASQEFAMVIRDVTYNINSKA